jgi:hypothetical protein
MSDYLDDCRVLFVLGAGASVPLGMPTTFQLRQRLCDETPDGRLAVEIHPIRGTGLQRCHGANPGPPEPGRRILFGAGGTLLSRWRRLRWRSRLLRGNRADCENLLAEAFPPRGFPVICPRSPGTVNWRSASGHCSGMGWPMRAESIATMSAQGNSHWKSQTCQ